MVTAGLVPVLFGTAGCLGLNKDPKLDAALARYRGRDFTVGYPRAWAPPAGDRRLVPGSLFEVITPVSVGPTASFDILTHWGGVDLLDGVVSDFMQVSRRQRGFRLIGEETVDIDGHTGYEVSKEYRGTLGATSGRFRTVDWFAPLKSGTVVDVRIGFAADRYDAALVTSVRRSLSVD